MKLKPLAPTWVMPIAVLNDAARGVRHQAEGVQGGDVGIIGQRHGHAALAERLLNAAARMALSKLWICCAVGWPPKRLVICELLYHGWALPVVIGFCKGYGPLPRLINASTGPEDTGAAAHRPAARLGLHDRCVGDERDRGGRRRLARSEPVA